LRDVLQVLALNATIGAVRPGESGVSFALVVQKIKELAREL
jgi:methyl-accepting chemotaxis protein